MIEPAPLTALPARRTWLWPAIGGLLLVAGIGSAGWYLAQQRQLAEGQSLQLATQMQALEQSLAALRADQRANARTLQDSLILKSFET